MGRSQKVARRPARTPKQPPERLADPNGFYVKIPLSPETINILQAIAAHPDAARAISEATQAVKRLWKP